VTQGLLLDVAKEVDVIEPNSRFTAGLEKTPGVRSIFNVGLQDWRPENGDKYDLIWVQWCVGHLNDEQLVAFLEQCKSALQPESGIIVFKENMSHRDTDDFDEVDSAVTRQDSSRLGVSGLQNH
jgi:protein N-terminal methyltransferase